MDALEREIVLREMVIDLVEQGKSIDEAEEIIQNNLDTVAQEVRDEKEGQ